MADDDKGEKLTGSVTPVLFPVPSSVPSSSAPAAPRLFPSFSSASSVFPVDGNAPGSQTHGPSALQWLSNSSFPEDLLPAVPVALSYPSDAATPGVKLPGRDVQKHDHSAGTVSSSDLDSSGDEEMERDSAEERRKRKKKKRKRRKKEENRRRLENSRKEPINDPDIRKIGSLDSASVERKAAVSAWADVNKSLPKEYYFDSRGDPDNLAFGSLYRKDIARFFREEVREQATNDTRNRFLTRVIPLNWERDGLVESVAASRYWTSKASSRRWKLKSLKSSNLTERKPDRLGDFVPLEVVRFSEEKSGNLGSERREETWQEYVSNKTKEFNQLTRERPHDESVWIRFTEFQDELIQATEKKVVIRQLIEKKIAILEKSLQTHEDSEDLLILYLETCRRRDDAATLLSKWEHGVSRHSSSVRMWREFLHFRCGEFSIFSVSSLRSLYNHALQALTAARNRVQSEGSEEGNYGEDFVDAELAMVSIFVDLCRFNWQAGHHELAVGLFQSEIEYSVFSPPIKISESNKRRLFEAFWGSGAQRLGENGALGWVTWLEKEEQATEARLSSEAQLEEDQGGEWTGWSTPGQEIPDFNDRSQLLETEPVEMEEDFEVDAEDEHVEEDEASLLEKLGLSFDSSKKVDVKDARIWKRWSETELQRDMEEWLPLHPQFKNKSYKTEALEDGEEDQLERVVVFEDIQESLFSIQSGQARLSLIYQFIDFLDGPLAQWCCSNRASYISKMEPESLKGALLKDMTGIQGLESRSTLASLVGGPLWYKETKGRVKFLHDCLVLLRSVFPHDRRLLDSLLKAEDLVTEQRGPQSEHMVASRALAKKILKIHRKDLSMWAAYACIEAAAGNIVTARKVFDTTLASLSPLSVDSRGEAPILYLAYAELELAQVSDENKASAEQKVLYILCCLGSGTVYTAQASCEGLPATLLLKAHRGFRDHFLRLQKSSAGDLTERGAALIACVAMFEHLTVGYEAAAAVFEEGLAVCLPDKRLRSLECELLFLRYVGMLERSEIMSKPSKLRSIISRGFGQYSHNVKLLGAYMRSTSQSGMAHKLRWFLDDASQRHSSPTLWLFALSFEMWRPGAGPRIHSLFERALESKEAQHSVLLWRCYLAYEVQVVLNVQAARRVYFRAIHACPWSKALWLDGFLMLSPILSVKEQSEFVDVIRDKELRLRTDVYEILLEDEEDEGTS